MSSFYNVIVSIGCPFVWGKRNDGLLTKKTKNNDLMSNTLLSPLHTATMANQLESLIYLLKQGADPNQEVYFYA